MKNELAANGKELVAVFSPVPSGPEGTGLRRAGPLGSLRALGPSDH